MSRYHDEVDPAGRPKRAYERVFNAGYQSAKKEFSQTAAGQRIARLEWEVEFYKNMFLKAYEQATGEKVPSVVPPSNGQNAARAQRADKGAS